MKPKKKLNVCPECYKKTKFVPICTRDVKGKATVLLGRYKCSECDWQSELQEPELSSPTRPKNPVYLISHYWKEGKTLFLWVYTTEKVVDPNIPIADLDRHLLTVEITPTSLRICPNVPFSIQKNRVEEGLMFYQDNKELIASTCAECSREQKMECLCSKEPCKKLDKSAR